MSEWKECNRRGRILSQVTCRCLSNRIYHPQSTVADINTCNICPYRNMEDDPDLPLVGEKKVQEGPGIIKMAGNLAKAVTNHVKDGGKKVDKETYEARLEQCNNCEFLKNNRCRHMSCGCFITKKAKWRSENCPIGRWPDKK